MDTCENHLWTPSTDESKGTAMCMECGTFSDAFIVVPRRTPVPCKTCGYPDGFICFHGPVNVQDMPKNCPECDVSLAGGGTFVNGSGAPPQQICANGHWVTGRWKIEVR